MKLALMEGPDMPIAVGIIRDVEEETYDAGVENQITEVQAKSKIKTFDDLMATCEQWEM
jgi:2-oxoglutarate ferredoxin oxidoreductase subunit beta